MKVRDLWIAVQTESKTGKVLIEENTVKEKEMVSGIFLVTFKSWCDPGDMVKSW